MMAALEDAWAAIQARHPQLPAAVIVLGAGSIGTNGGLRSEPDFGKSAGPAVEPDTVGVMAVARVQGRTDQAGGSGCGSRACRLMHLGGGDGKWTGDPRVG